MSKQEETRAPLFENLRKLINVIDELRDVGLQQYINLPRIAVLGTQSSGKSSLLESIMGIDCLPRGEGVVTRRPLELRLVHTPYAEKPWAIFEEFKTEKMFDFDKVRERINELTDKIAGKTKGIVDNPIVMTVYSANCPDLTLIDLPGITRIPLPGQQANIEKITKEMAKRYCTDPRTIILCVIPGNQDISTSDGLQLAREWDRNGERTIGVITKIDIMDKGTNAKKLIMGEEIHLKLGYVGVKGRSQQDIYDKMKVTRALEIEKEYFSTHPVYSTLPPTYLGTEALTQKLTKVLFGHIRLCLPDILKEIVQKVKQCEERLKDLGNPLPTNDKEKMQLIWNMISDFTENFKNILKGKYDGKRAPRLDEEVSGGAKIKLMFHELYKTFYTKMPSEIYDDKDIDLAIKYHQGDSIPGFPSIDAFLYLANPILDKLRDPANRLLDNVHGYLESLALLLIGKIFVRFPSIIDEISDITCVALRDEKEKTRELIEDLIESELNYIFTNDMSYLVNNSNFIPTAKDNKDGKPIDPNKLFVNELRNRMDSYITIVLRNIRDLIPKIIGTFLVNKVQTILQYTIYNQINEKQELMDLLGEPPHISTERETLNKILMILNKAKKVLQKDPDLSTTLKQEENKQENDGQYQDYSANNYAQQQASKIQDQSKNVSSANYNNNNLQSTQQPQSNYNMQNQQRPQDSFQNQNQFANGFNMQNKQKAQQPMQIPIANTNDLQNLQNGRNSPKNKSAPATDPFGLFTGSNQNPLVGNTGQQGGKGYPPNQQNMPNMQNQQNPLLNPNGPGLGQNQASQASKSQNNTLFGDFPAKAMKKQLKQDDILLPMMKNKQDRKQDLTSKCKQI